MIRLLSWTIDEALHLHEFDSNDYVPPYAILSHTWDLDNNNEVSHGDIKRGSYQKPGLQKIHFCLRQAQVLDYAYVWIDSCCINRNSEPELSEAINSMFKWYSKAARCLVYLSDVQSDAGQPADPRAFCDSRWFTRGWTLQELLAPQHVDFYSKDGTYLGDKSSLEYLIVRTTRVPAAVLRGRGRGGCTLGECSIYERLSWAQSRQTKREEDQIYSLLGLFSVNMTLIYGEGLTNATRRLRESIAHYTPVNARRDTHVEPVSHTQHHGTYYSSMSLDLRLQMPNLQPASNRIDDISFAPPSNSAAIKQLQNEELLELQASSSRLANQLSFLLYPGGLFESMPSFRPWHYMQHNLGPQLIRYSSVPIELHGYYAIDQQDLLVAKTPSLWLRIKTRQIISTQSVQWSQILKISATYPSYNKDMLYSRALADTLKSIMASMPDISDDAEITFVQNQLHQGVMRLHSVQLESSLVLAQRCRDITQELVFQKVPVFYDRCFAAIHVQNMFFIVDLNHKWMGYHVVTVGERGLNLIWQSITAGIRLRNAEHVMRLIGIVRSSEHGLMKGLLVELPSKGPIFRLLEHHRYRGEPVPWPVRQRWAKQIVKGVSKYHENGLVIGGLRTYNNVVSIDKSDNAVVIGISTGSHPAVHGSRGLLPPECRNEAFAHSAGAVDSRFDIFQLGLLLWHLYRDEWGLPTAGFCNLARCQNIFSEACHEHDDPIELPRALMNMPDYLLDVIDQCRRRNPSQRPTAQQLLRMFPSEEELDAEIKSLGREILIRPGRDTEVQPDIEMPRIELMRHMLGPKYICSRCTEVCVGSIYECRICDRGNFDLCSTCFAKGEHCWQSEHLLCAVDIRPDATRDTKEQQVWFSSIDDSGTRRKTTAG